ncbi:MAG: hypothetical protein E7160_05230 [Firmicutes bacterium]|nr:hypothetical protein [Bacillota bacterium]
MNKYIKLKLIGTTIAFLLTFPIHFLYSKFPNIITSIISPVNESIAEHMKILFTSILIAGVIQKLIVIKKNLKINNVCISNFIAALLSIPIFLIMFLPLYKLIGENLPITIIIMFIAIIISELISLYIMTKNDLKLENKAIIFTIIIYMIFYTLTIYPPDTNFFIDPINNTKGIKKDISK